MPLADGDISRETDGFFNEEYCKWCYRDGSFAYESMDELLDFLAAHMANESFSPDQVREYMRTLLPPDRLESGRRPRLRSLPPTLPLPHRSPEIPRSRLRSGPVFSAALKCHLRSAAFRPPPSEYTEFPAPPLPSPSPAVRSASVPAQKSQVPEPAAQSSGYRESQVPFPLVKDIVGYLKMCHSILPIKR